MKLTKLVSRLFKLFIPSTIEEIAKSTGFMRRHSKLLPETFAKAMTLGLLDEKNITEEVIAQKCASIQNSVSLSKQAIQARLNDSASFLKELLKNAFSLIYTTALAEHSSLLLEYFTDVKVLDATTISLPDQVQTDYVGMGGRNAKAALKIQTLYSAVNHTITHFDITSGVTHDSQCLTEMIKQLSKNDLFLADLGYFDINLKLSDVPELSDSEMVWMARKDTQSGGGSGDMWNVLEAAAQIKLLKPNQIQLDIPEVEGVAITNVGFIDGRLHIQTKWEENNKDRHGYFYLVDQQAEQIKVKENNFYLGVDENNKIQFGRQYVEYILDIDKENIEQLKLVGCFAEDEEVIEGERNIIYIFIG